MYNLFENHLSNGTYCLKNVKHFTKQINLLKFWLPKSFTGLLMMVSWQINSSLRQFNKKPENYQKWVFLIDRNQWYRLNVCPLFLFLFVVFEWCLRLCTRWRCSCWFRLLSVAFSCAGFFPLGSTSPLDSWRFHLALLPVNKLRSVHAYSWSI